MKEIIKVKEWYSKHWLSDCTIDLQYLVHVEGKCIRSVFCYLSPSNGYQYQY